MVNMVEFVTLRKSVVKGTVNDNKNFKTLEELYVC